MKNFILVFIIICISAFRSPALTLSPAADISILTCSQGSELYSLFGHTAIRVADPQNDVDIVFNYGTFDFDTPGFYLKYAQGLLPYQLSISSYVSFIRNYQLDNRSVYSQTLCLDSLEKQKLVDLLIENYQPANRSYLYNFLFDNCTTRSRDIIQNSLNDKIEWKIKDSDKSFWNLLDECMNISPWVQWGIHSILGQPGNREATTFEYTFLPDNLMLGLDSAVYKNQRLAADTEILFQAVPEKISNPWFRNPFFVFAAGVLFLIILLQKFKHTALLNTITAPFLIFTGILGCLIVFLGFFTQHPITAPNWNILWANPLNLIALFFIFKKRLPKSICIYLKIYIALLIVAIPVWFIAQPAVPFASISFILMMIYLSFRQLRKL